MRSLLGGAKEALVHDPGAEGPEGEGEAAMTMLVIVYAVALGLVIYGTHPPSQLTVTFGRASPRPRPTPELTAATPRRSSRRSGRTRAPRGAPRGAPRATPPGATPPLVPPPKQREKRIKKTREAKIPFKSFGLSLHTERVHLPGFSIPPTRFPFEYFAHLAHPLFLPLLLAPLHPALPSSRVPSSSSRHSSSPRGRLHREIREEGPRSRCPPGC